jgi:hypothetical protein
MDKPKTLARRLLRENRGTRSKEPTSWRNIAKRYDIPAGTLNRFALSEGAWLPKDEYQIVLGLKRQKKSTHRKPLALIDMCTDELRKAIINRETMPEPTFNRSVMSAFIRACKQAGALKRARTS